MDLYVQCKALSPTHVSQYHNTVGQNAGPDKIVLLGKVIQIASLSNTTFVNLNTQMIKSSEKFLDNFIIFQRNLQCLIPTTIILNKVEQSCLALQVLKLEDGFELEANSKTLTDFHIQASLNKRLNFGNDYKFSNLPHSYFEEVEEDPSWMSPIIDDFLLDGTEAFILAGSLESVLQ